MTEPDTADTTHLPTVLDAADPAHQQALAVLRADPGTQFVDQTRGAPVEHTRWVHYPWRRAVVHLPGPAAFRRVRLDRNRHLVTVDELERLSRIRVGVVGLSVGHAIAYGLAAEGLCGALRLADFDALELTNLNRVPATVFDLGVNKAVACARRIAELDPYLPVEVMPSGITSDTVDEFLDGLDIVVEECDSLDIKVLIRHAARVRGLPVLMATSSGGLLDVERFDEEPARPVFHGLLGDVDTDQLSRLSTKEKVPQVLKVIDAAVLRPRMQASLLEVGKTLSTWPQLSSEVAIGAASVAEAVRRIGLGEELHSGRVRVDLPALLDGIVDPAPDHTGAGGAGEPVAMPVPVPAPGGAMEAVAAAAGRAPSGGNSQPWRLEIQGDTVTIGLDAALTSAMDVGFRGSAVAVGAAAFNARVAAAAHRRDADVSYQLSEGPTPLTAAIRTTPGGDAALARQYDAMWCRETNRHTGTRGPVTPDVIAALTGIAEAEGARLRLTTTDDGIAGIASILAAADRIRYLTPDLHAQMIGELRWPGSPHPDTGIDVRSLELDDADLAFLDILRSGPVMANLAAWDAGTALGDATQTALEGASAVAVVTVRGDTLVDYARGGSAVEAVWIRAQDHGLAVQPMSPAFLYARGPHELDALSPAFSGQLADLQYSLRRFLGTEPDESLVLILRLSHAPRASVPSRRREGPGRSAPT